MRRIKSTEMVSHGSTMAHRDINRYRDIRQWKLEIPELDRSLQVNRVSSSATRPVDYFPARPSLFRAIFAYLLDWVDSDRNYIMGGIGLALMAISAFVALYLGAFG